MFHRTVYATVQIIQRCRWPRVKAPILPHLRVFHGTWPTSWTIWTFLAHSSSFCSEKGPLSGKNHKIVLVKFFGCYFSCWSGHIFFQKMGGFLYYLTLQIYGYGALIFFSFPKMITSHESRFKMEQITPIPLFSVGVILVLKKIFKILWKIHLFLCIFLGEILSHFQSKNLDFSQCKVPLNFLIAKVRI